MKNKRQEEPEMTQKSHIIEIVIMIVAVLILIMTLFFSALMPSSQLMLPVKEQTQPATIPL